MIMGNEALSLGGELHLVLGGTDVYKLSGALEIAEVARRRRASVVLDRRQVRLRRHVRLEKYGLGIEGSVEGWVDGARAFNAKGNARSCCPNSRSAASRCSRAWASRRAAAASGPDVGFGYGWGDSARRTFFAVLVRPRALDGATRRSPAPRPSGRRSPAKLPLATFAIVGADGAAARHAHGARRTDDHHAGDGGGIDDGRVMLFRNPADNTTYVAVDRPAGGRWQIDELPGSTAVTQRAACERAARREGDRPRRARRPPPAPALRQSAHRRPARRVRRADAGRPHAVAGHGPRDRGSLAIRPEPGRIGKRTVFAMVSQYDLPRDELTVTSYTPPRLAGARIARLKLVARGGRCEPPGARWRCRSPTARRCAPATAGACCYLDLRKPALTVKGSPRRPRDRPGARRRAPVGPGPCHHQDDQGAPLSSPRDRSGRSARSCSPARSC